MRRLGGSVVLALAALALGAGPAGAQQPPDPDGHGTDYFVTFAARVCPTYTDITANKARNNIQESLRDLGPDTQYGPNDVVNPTQELQMQPNCLPLPGWRFTLGTGIAANRVVGPWGALSVVSGAYSTDVTTLASIQDRDKHGNQVSSTLEGATTIELTTDQLNQAKRSNLWVQGGTTTDPVLNQQFPGEYGFGALRCATDNVNGDNVEYVAFPSNTQRVYCFAYYVKPPPTSGTIVIKKHVSNPPNANQTFTFQGNISYTENHDFQLAVKNGADASMTFYRAATVPGNAATLWNVAEVVPAGWNLSDITCTAPGGSGVTRTSATGVAIALVAADTVTCTFTNALNPPPGRLTIAKVTRGGVGTFPFSVTDSSDHVVASPSATTIVPGVPVLAGAGPIKLDPGTYRVGEELPDTPGGDWQQTSAVCNAEPEATRGLTPVEVKITSDKGQVCVFENTFVPNGRITILKTTVGGTGTTGFIVTPLDDQETQFLKTATTTAEDRPARARGDSTRHLPMGRYLIQETATVSDDDREWELSSVTCGGRLRAFEGGQVIVELTPDHPARLCRFVNTVVAPPEPPQPEPTPTPTPPGPTPTPEPIDPGTPGAPQPDIVISKRALRSSVRVGGIATYVVTVRNVGAAPAENVVVADAPGRRGQLVSARPSQGECNEQVPTVCRLGTLGAGERVTIRVRVRATAAPSMANLAVVGSGTFESTLRNNVAAARVRVRRSARIEACLAASGPKAHAAC
jgi:hypothetical protein